jgi:hypothetical protein
MSTATATLDRKCNLHQLILEGILWDNKIPLKYWADYFDLTYYGVPLSDAARKCKGRAAAIQGILTELSNAYYKEKGIRFPPPGWKPGMRKAS